MSSLSRRGLLRSGLALSASSLLASPGWARTAALLAQAAEAGAAGTASAVAPRERLLMDFGWSFLFGNGDDPTRDLGFGKTREVFAKTGDFAFAKVGYDDSKWRKLNLPHDWAVELPFVWDEELKSNGYKPLGRKYPETSVGWYRREFEIAASDAGRRIAVEFDGAQRDVLVFVNGCFIGRSDSGYTPFRFDITDFAVAGAKNCIALRVDASYGAGWFYEGAGIYRHAWLTRTDALHLAPLESYVRAILKENSASLSLEALVSNEGNSAEPVEVEWQIVDADGRTVAGAPPPSRPIRLGPASSERFNAEIQLPHPSLWSPEAPYLYEAIATVKTDGRARDAERIPFGVRTARFDADTGFSLNGQAMKIQGTCNHQDHAGVGAALPDRLQYFRVGVLKQMGCNAVRTSHNMPTPEFVEACDRMGMMMMCETRQMSSSPEGLAELEAMVKRYRNSPSIILWSIGNEEWQLQGTMAKEGAKIGAAMVERCHELDPTRMVSAAVNGDNEQGVSDALDIIGFNYGLQRPDGYHKRHPARPIYGSETASTIGTRGVYRTDPLRNTMSSYDVPVQWGESAEEWWTFYATREWEAGGFAWTGFDYRGEPTPYGWPSINSNFGIVDTCGFPKDDFYYYKAWWTSEPVLHLFPHWNWEGEEGEEIAVWVYSNLDEVELLVNGKSAGRQKVPRLGHLQWSVRYQPGAIEAQGWKDGKLTLTEKRETTGAVASLRLTADRMEIDADGEDAAVITVDALDSDGRVVPIASNPVEFNVSGDGALIGVGNGDPNCQESDKEPKRSLFSGLAEAIVQSTKTAGTITIEAVTGGHVKPAKVVITTKTVEPRPAG